MPTAHMHKQSANPPVTVGDFDDRNVAAQCRIIAISILAIVGVIALVAFL